MNEYILNNKHQSGKNYHFKCNESKSKQVNRKKEKSKHKKTDRKKERFEEWGGFKERNEKIG